MKCIIFLVAVFSKVSLLYSAPNSTRALRRAAEAAQTPLKDLQDKILLFNMCFPSFEMASLIPASVKVQSSLSSADKTRILLNLQILEKLLENVSPLRSTFAATAFMLQNPHLMAKFMAADPGHDNGLSLLGGDLSARQLAVQLLQQFDAFVRSFNVGALLEAAGQVSLDTVQEAVPHLEQLHKILGGDAAFGTFIQGLAFMLTLQQYNPPPDAAGTEDSVPLGGLLMAAKGSMLKRAGKMADTVFENIKDVNDAVQQWTSVLKMVPVVGRAMEPVHTAVNKILDGVHMVVGNTAEAIGNLWQAEGKKLLAGRNRPTSSSSFANDRKLELDRIIRD